MMSEELLVPFVNDAIGFALLFTTVWLWCNFFKWTLLAKAAGVMAGINLTIIVLAMIIALMP